MKKKLTALVALAAMLISLLPAAAFAAEGTTPPAETKPDIDITTVQFNNDLSQREMFIILKGKDVEAGQRITCILEGVNQPVYTGTLAKNNENVIKLDKTTIPGLSDPTSDLKMHITISNATNSKIIVSKPVEPDFVGVAPTMVRFSVKDGDGVKDRQFIVSFDSQYYPSNSDQVVLQAYDENGKKVGKEESRKITASSLNTELDDAGFRNLKDPITWTLDDKAKTVRASFWRDGKEMEAFTNSSISLAPRYGELKELKLEFPSSEVHRGETVKGTLWYVNKAGKRYDVTNDGVTYLCSATDSIENTFKNTKPEITIKKDAEYGKKISVIAVYGTQEPVNAVLTVTEKLTENPIKLDTTQGKADKDLSIDMQLVDSNGKNTKLDFVPTKIEGRFIDEAGNQAKDFKFIARGFDGLNRNGTLSAILEKDTPAKGKLEIIFSDNKGNKYKAVSAFTFTDPNVKDNNSAVFTIGSREVLVNGKTKTIEVAPFISQNRTFVPLRAVNESMGAIVEWNDSKREITIKDDDKVIVMHPGSVNYTINGKAQKPMDVAPYIASASGRTIVPLRFVIEALDYNVEPVYNPNGTTAKVIISNK